MDLSYYFSNTDFEPFSCQPRAVTSTDADYQEFSRLNLSLSTNVTLHNPDKFCFRETDTTEW